MLIQFTVENFLSFRDKVTFSMLASEGEQRHQGHLVEDGHGHQVLPIAALYGANGSGKSNFVKAIAHAQNLIIEGTKRDQKIVVSRFRLSESVQSSSSFEFIFISNGTQYSYGFRLGEFRILEEWLYATPSGEQNEVLFFERSTPIKDKVEIEYGSLFQDEDDEQRQFLQFVARGTRPNQLFLTEAIDRNVQELMPIYGWFVDSLRIIPAESDFTGLAIGVINNREFTEFLSESLRLTGTGISSIVVERKQIDTDQYLSMFPEPLQNDLREDFIQADSGALAILETHDGKIVVFQKGESEEIHLVNLKAQHQGKNSYTAYLDLNEESDGTQRLISLLPILFSMKENSDIVFIIDELDRRLHPLLSQHFIQRAIACNTQNSQFIFTTHDTNLLDLNILRRDEIWFVEKGEHGNSNLYSLVEFKIRPDMEIDKGYLNGRFGAIPFLGDPERLGWLDDVADESE